MGRIELGAWPINARCPGCGEVTHHRVLSVGADGRTKRVRCQSCGREWTWERRANLRVAATSEAERRKPKPKREVRTCPWCGREFVPVRGTQVWCSADCRDRGRRHHTSAIAGLIAQTKQLERKMREAT